MSFGPQGTYFSEIVFKIHKFLFREMKLKMSSAKCRPFGLRLNMSIRIPIINLASSVSLMILQRFQITVLFDVSACTDIFAHFVKTDISK